MRCAPQIACLFALGWALMGAARAQEVPPADPWQLAPENRPAAPDVFLLPDGNGKLRQVLGFRYDDFLRAWNNQAAADGVRPPRYVLDALEVSGSTAEGHARLRIELRLTTHDDGWIDVPLELPNIIVQHVDLGRKVEGECFVFDAGRQGHVAWLQGQAGRQRTIVLNGLARITSGTGRSELEISPPHATVSRFALSVPATDVQFETSADVQLSTAVANDQTEVVLRGYANPLRLQWNRRHEPASGRATTLESVGQMTVQVDRRQALYSASLTINSFGNPLEVLRVRLPQGARTTRVQAPPELQAVVTETEDEAGQEAGRIVEVRLQRPSGNPWVLELSAEQLLEEEDAASLCQVGGFEVVGAVRQSGQLELEVDEQLQAYFDLAGDLEQVPLADSQDQASASVAFSYARFPWTLSVHTLPKQRRVNVQPRYELQINPDEARLQVEFDYQFSGARTFAVRVDLRGWQLTDDPLESGGAVDANRYVETQDGLLVLPLVNPDVQRARIALVVRKPLGLGEQTFPLPEALGGFVLPGELSVSADSSLQVTTDLSSLEGLGAVTAAEQQTTGDDSPLVFRTFLSQAALDVEITRRERQVAVDIRTTVDVAESHLSVQQQFDYDVKYRPLSQLLLQVPEMVAEGKTLEARLDGKKVSVGLAVPAATGAKTAARQMVVTLPRPLQQAFRLEIAYEIPYLEATPENPVQVTLPLVVPVDPVASHRATVGAKQPWQVALSQSAGADAWSVRQADNSHASSGSSLQLRSEGEQPELPLSVRKQSLQDLQNAILERAWLQSWVAGGRQQDRAVFRFNSPHARVHVELPAEVASQPLEVLLDGKPVEFQQHAEGRISAALPNDSPRARHVLEVRYQHSAKLLNGGTLRTALPRLVCRPMSAPVFWHLVLPRGWQVARSPEAMASEYWLGWKQLRWGRQPTRSQADLQQWSGASIVPPPPPSASEYLYSSFDIPLAVEVVVARQAWLVAASTLAVFGIGLLCVYTPIAGKVSFWLGLVLVLLALLFVYPEVAMLAGQAIFWGGVMTLAAIVLRRTFAGRTGSEIMLSASATPTPSVSATESWVQKHRVTSDADDQPTIASHTSGSDS